MDRCITLSALFALLTFTPAKLLAPGGQDRGGLPISCRVRKTTHNIVLKPLGDSVCTAVRESKRYGSTNFPVTRHKKKLKLEFTKEASRFVLIAASGKPCGYLIEVTSHTGKIKNRQVECTSPRGRQYEVVPVDANTRPIGEETKNNKIEATTKPPMGCYNWRPDNFTLLPTGADVIVTWSPSFEMGGLEIFLYDVDKRERPHHKEIASYEKHITEHRFAQVTSGRYEAWIKPTGCDDCPDYDYNGVCTVDPIRSEPVSLEMTAEIKPTTQQDLCYNWRPKSLTLIPANNDVTVTWSPAFDKDGGLVIDLFDLNKKKTIYHKEFASYDEELHVITEYTFHNVSSDRYEARIKPTGCDDCPAYDYNGVCSIDPIASEPVNLGISEGIEPMHVVNRTMKIQDLNPIFAMAGLTSVALIAVVAMAVMCRLKDEFPFCKTKSVPVIPQTAPHIMTIRQARNHEDRRPRIVILYGVDHYYHIAAVMSFASLLRRLLDADVIVDREQGRAATCNISDWMTNTLSPATHVIVISSEALYQLSCYQNSQTSDLITRAAGDMFAWYSPLALSYVQHQSFSSQAQSQMILLVSFGYGHGDESLAKFTDSYRLLFKGVGFEVTVKRAETRSQNLTDLLRCLSADGCEPVVDKDMPEMDDFLARVDIMDDHIRANGSAWWENIDASSYNSGATGNPRPDLQIESDAFSVVSELTASSVVTVSVLCKGCHANGIYTLPTGHDDVRSLSARFSDGQQSDSSCLTLHMPDPDTENSSEVFTPSEDVSERTVLLYSGETLDTRDLETSVEFDSDDNVPGLDFSQSGSRTSSVSVLVAGREC